MELHSIDRDKHSNNCIVCVILGENHNREQKKR